MAAPLDDVAAYEDAPLGVTEVIACVDHYAGEVGYLLQEGHLALELIAPLPADGIGPFGDGGLTGLLLLSLPVDASGFERIAQIQSVEIQPAQGVVWLTVDAKQCEMHGAVGVDGLVVSDKGAAVHSNDGGDRGEDGHQDLGNPAQCLQDALLLGGVGDDLVVGENLTHGVGG